MASDLIGVIRRPHLFYLGGVMDLTKILNQELIRLHELAKDDDDYKSIWARTQIEKIHQVLLCPAVSIPLGSGFDLGKLGKR